MVDYLVIDKAEQLIQWLDALIDGQQIPNETRHRLAAGCFDVALEHQKAIVLLIARQLYGSAFALSRLQAEAYVRGLWLHKCADDKAVENFQKDKIPKFTELLYDIENLEPYKDGVLSNMHKRSWKAMCSYTHTGFQQVSRRQTETTIEANYDDQEVEEVIDFSVSIGCLSAIEIALLGDNVDLASQVLDRIRQEWPTSA